MFLVSLLVTVVLAIWVPCVVAAPVATLVHPLIFAVLTVVAMAILTAVYLDHVILLWGIASFVPIMLPVLTVSSANLAILEMQLSRIASHVIVMIKAPLIPNVMKLMGCVCAKKEWVDLGVINVR